MRGGDLRTDGLFSYVSCEARVAKDHPLRTPEAAARLDPVTGLPSTWRRIRWSVIDRTGSGDGNFK
jgi:hypothetical protein